MTTQRPAGVRERVLLVDGAADTKHRLAVAGFAIDEVTAVSLRNDWAIESAPLLLVADSSGGVRYAGGYSTQKQGPLIEDLALFASVTKGEDVLALPLFGCAVSQQLKTAIDPLGLQRLLAWRPFS